MSNKGIKNVYNQITGTEVGNYYINLCKNDNNIILEIPLGSVVANDINLSLFYNHQCKNINGDFGKGFRLNYFNELTGIYENFYREKSDYTYTYGSGSICNIISDNERLIADYIDHGEDDYELLGLYTYDFNGNYIYNTYNRIYPNYIQNNKGERITFNFTSNILNSITNQKGDNVSISYNLSNLINNISIYHNNNLINYFTFSYDNDNRLTNISSYNSNNYLMNQIEIQFDQNYVKFIYKDNTVTKNEFTYTFDNLNLVTSISNYYGDLTTFTYYDNKTIVINNNKEIRYYFNNGLLTYTKDDKSNMSYYKYDIYNRLIYNVNDINMMIDTSYPITYNQTYQLDSDNKYLIAILSNNNGINSSTVTINNTQYTFTGLFSMIITNSINISLDTNIESMIFYENKEFEVISYVTSKPFISTIQTLYSSKVYSYDNNGNMTGENETINDINGTHIINKIYTYTNYKLIRYQKIFDNHTQEEFTYEYNSNNTIKKIINNLSASGNDEEEYKYFTDDAYVLNEKIDKYNKTIYTYDNEYKELKKVIKNRIINEKTYEIESTYNDYNNVTNVNEKFYKLDIYDVNQCTNGINNISTYTNTYLTNKTLSSQYPYSDTKNYPYDFEYDAKGRTRRIKHRTNILKEINYLSNGRIDTISNYNRLYKYNYSNNDNTLSSINLNNQPLLSFTYDNKERVTRIDDEINNTYKTYNYDTNDKVISYYDSERSLSINNKYNKKTGIIKNKKESVLHNLINYNYNYINDEELEVIISNSNKTYNYDYDYIRLYLKDTESDNGIKPISNSNSYVAYGGIYYNNSNNLKYNFNINDYGTIYFEFYLTNTTNKNLYKMKDNYNREIIISIKNGKYYFKAPNHTEVNTNVSATVGSHKILLVLDTHYVEDGEEEYKYSVYQLVIDNYNNSFEYEYDGIDYYNLNSEFYIPVSSIIYRTYSILVSETNFNELETKYYKYNRVIEPAHNDYAYLEVRKQNGQLLFVKDYGIDGYDRVVTMDYSYIGSSKKIRCNYDDTNKISRINLAYDLGQPTNPVDDYEYDSLGRVIKSMSSKINGNTITHNYSYYNNGEIKTFKGQSYYYTNNVLTSIGSDTISYENTYFMSEYLDNRYSYTNNKMTGFINDEYDFSYEYNAQGLRISKIDNDTNLVTRFTYDENNNIIREKIGNNTVYYLYFDNEIIGFIYNGIRYHYLKDMIGRICYILNDSGIIVTYRYDAYGELLQIIDDSQNNIGEINHIIYKSYYYDFESGLYYLKSRYYNPSIGIFIQPDKADYLQFDDIRGYGLYTYCFNNPVLYSDPDGNFGIIASLVFGAMIGAIAGGAMAAGIGYVNGERGKDLLGNTINGAIKGVGIGIALVLGAAIGSAAIFGGVGVAIGTVSISGGTAFGLAVGVSAVTAGLGYSANVAISEEKKWSIGSFIKAVVIGAIDGAVSFGAGYASGYLGLRTPTYNYKIGNFMKVARFLFEKTLSAPMYILNMLE